MKILQQQQEKRVNELANHNYNIYKKDLDNFAYFTVSKHFVEKFRIQKSLHKLSWKKLEPNILTNYPKNLLKSKKKELQREISRKSISAKSWKNRCIRQTWIP